MGPQSSVHQNMVKEIKNKKRKLDNRKSAENGNNDDQEPLVKKFKSQRVDKECGYAAIPPPANLYKNSKRKDAQFKKEAIELIESAMHEQENKSEFQFQNESNVEQKQQFIPTPMPQMYPQQMYQQGLNQNYAYNPYMHQYNAYQNYMNAYQNMAYQNYQYQYQNMGQYPYQSQQTQPVNDPNTASNSNSNETNSAK